MSKDEAVEFLKEKGYRAVNEHGIVMVHESQETISFDELQTLCRENGYVCSLGLCPVTTKESN